MEKMMVKGMILMLIMLIDVHLKMPQKAHMASDQLVHGKDA
jgi:hypothetical protein